MGNETSEEGCYLVVKKQKKKGKCLPFSGVHRV